MEDLILRIFNLKKSVSTDSTGFSLVPLHFAVESMVCGILRVWFPLVWFQRVPLFGHQETNTRLHGCSTRVLSSDYGTTLIANALSFEANESGQT